MAKKSKRKRSHRPAFSPFNLFNLFRLSYEIASIPPWWLGLSLAALIHFVLHQRSLQVLPPLRTVPFSHWLHYFVHAGFIELAAVGQILFPALLVIGAAGSYWAQRARRQRLLTVARAAAVNSLNDMTWQQFELLVGEYFKNQGFAVELIGGGGADGGVDLRLKADGNSYLVQCKQWKAYQVGVNIARELYGVMAAEGVQGGYVVTSGKFTQPAYRFAHGKNLWLIDGKELFGRIQGAHSA